MYIHTGDLARGIPHRLWSPQRASARETASDRHRPYACPDGLRWQWDGGHQRVLRGTYICVCELYSCICTYVIIYFCMSHIARVIMCQRIIRLTSSIFIFST